MPKGTGRAAVGGTKDSRRRFVEIARGSAADKAYNVDQSRELLGSLPLEQWSAVGAYTGTRYREINAHLRVGAPISQTSKGRIEQIDKAFSKKNAVLKSDTILYRGVGKNDPIARRYNMGMLKVGTEFSDKGFVSTSTAQSVAQSFSAGTGLSYRIRARKGTRALPVESWSRNPGELETILKRGSKFRITGVDTSKNQILVDLL